MNDPLENAPTNINITLEGLTIPPSFVPMYGDPSPIMQWSVLGRYLGQVLLLKWYFKLRFIT